MLNETTRIGFKSLGSLGTIPILILEKKINNGLTNPIFPAFFFSNLYTKNPCESSAFLPGTSFRALQR